MADVILGVAADLVVSGRYTRAGSFILKLAFGFESSSNPAELPEFGKPGYPSQSFITMAAQMRLGERDEAFKLLAQIEQKFQQITDAASRCRYWAYDGWTHVLGGHPDIAGSKFDRAISTAISVSPPSAACDALACIARIMAAAGRSADALRVLDLAVGQSVDMSGAIFSDRSGLIDSGTSRHAAVAASWTADLKENIDRVRTTIRNSDAFSRTFLGDLLMARGYQSILDQLASANYRAAVSDIRSTILADDTHNFDRVLLLSACASELGCAADLHA